MAEQATQNRTEAASPRRRQQAREEGKVAFSADFVTGAAILAMALLFWSNGPVLGESLVDSIRFALTDGIRRDWTAEDTTSAATTLFQRFCQLTGPLMIGSTAVIVLVCVLQVGFHITTKPLLPDWQRLSPQRGWERILSAPSQVRFLFMVAKLLAIGVTSWWIVSGRWSTILATGDLKLAPALQQLWDILVAVLAGSAAMLLLLGGTDYLFQRWRHEEDLRMTRQELKEEQKQEEGDSRIKAHIRRLQREMAQRRMMKDVPKATVVISNPTHFAVALKYERGSMQAPKVVAKGADLLAKRIITIAEANGVPVLRRPPLARMLYASVKLGQEIPASLYTAVAEIIAFVYRLRQGGRRTG